MNIYEHILKLDRAVKDLKKKICCVDGACPPLSTINGDNVAQCLEDGLYVPPAAEPTPENPFTNLQYTNALLYVNRYFSQNGITVVEPSNPLTASGSGISFTISATDFSNGLFVLTSAAGNYDVTMPLASDIKTAMGITQAGSYFDYIVANSGSGLFTFIVNTGITAQSAVTGGTDLTVAAGETATFRFTAKESGNTYNVARIN